MMERLGYAKYESYKDSGLDWLGPIPEGWELLRSKFVWRESEGRSLLGSEELLSVSQYHGIVPRMTDSRSEDLTGYKLVNKGELVTNIMLAWMGSLGISDHKGIVSPAYAVYELIGDASPHFLGYLYKTAQYLAEFARRSSGVVPSRWRMYTDDFDQVPTLLPTKQEQHAIVAFLDDKCAKVDGAVKIKEDQIALLRERRQIIIQDAVTRGLNPAAPMKDSGIDWIGQIPAHWAVKSIRYAFRFRNYQRIPISASEREGKQGEYPYYGASGIIDYVQDYIFDEDLILIAEDGANLLSKSTPLAFVATGKYWVNNHAHILEPLFPGFKYWAELLSAADYTVYISGSAQPKLTRDRLASVRVPVPPADERSAIITFIESESEKFRNAIAIKERQIAALKEYKTSLINAAVTGKIKVI
jgi:type I restriction enzyme S subunit